MRILKTKNSFELFICIFLYRVLFVHNFLFLIQNYILYFKLIDFFLV